METKKQKIEDKSNIIYVKIFIVLVLSLFLLSLVIKSVSLYRSHRFTGNSFTILYINPSGRYIVGVNSRLKTLSTVKVEGVGNFDLKDSLKDSILLGVPIHAIISTKSNDASSQSLLSIPYVVKILTGTSHDQMVNVNAFDIIKMYMVSKSVPNTNILNFSMKIDQPSEVIDEHLYALFKNEDIINEKTSIEIINTTDISGLGSKFARVLKNSGFNVVSVISRSEQKNSKMISRVDEKNLANVFLFHFLNLPIEYQNDQAIADISIILGNDIKDKGISP